MKHNNSFTISKNALRVPINIFGSGVSGLLMAYQFLKLGFTDVRIFTKGRGIIQSLNTPDGVVELAANSILQNESVTEILEELECEYEYYSKEGRKKFIFHDSKASKWPLSFWETLKSIWFLLCLAFKVKRFKPKPQETVREWGDRTIGPLLSQRLVERGLQGIYGPRTQDLSASLCLAGLFEKRKKSKGSLSFKNGMGSFIKILENEISMMGGRFSTVMGRSIEKRPEGITVVSTPAYSLPGFVKSDLSAIDYHSITTVTFIVDEKDRLPFKGFGCLFDHEEAGVLGVILNSDLFDNRAPSGKVSETWILEGNEFKSENDLGKLKSFRSEKFEIKTQVENYFFKHWDKAFPVYNIELEKALDRLKSEGNVYFFANWTGKIGIGKLIEESSLFAKKIIKDMSKKEEKK